MHSLFVQLGGAMVFFLITFFISSFTLAQNITTYEVPISVAKTSSTLSSLLRSTETKIFFDDLVPGANWSHPAQYRLVGTKGELLETIPVRQKPKELSQYRLVKGKEMRWGKEIEIKINDFKGSLRITDPQNYFALLIDGQGDERHWNDFSFLYQTLTQVYGYLPENIFIADSAFKDKKPDLDSDGKNDILFGSSAAEVKNLMGELKQKLSKDSHLFIAVNDHGDTEEGQSTIILNDGSMSAKEFSEWLNSLTVSSVLSVFEQCYSGGFVRPSVGENRVAMSAATNLEYSWSTQDLAFDEFIYHVTSAFAKQTHDGKAVNSDLNQDGFISAKEAFTYASGKDERSESPLLEAYNNSGNFFGIGISKRKLDTITHTMKNPFLFITQP